MNYEHIKNHRKVKIIEARGDNVRIRHLNSQAKIEVPAQTFYTYFKPALSRYTCLKCAFSVKGEQMLRLTCVSCGTPLREDVWP